MIDAGQAVTDHVAAPTRETGSDTLVVPIVGPPGGCGSFDSCAGVRAAPDGIAQSESVFALSNGRIGLRRPGSGLHIAHRIATLHGWELALSRSNVSGLAVERAGPPTSSAGPAIQPISQRRAGRPGSAGPHPASASVSASFLSSLSRRAAGPPRMASGVLAGCGIARSTHRGMGRPSRRWSARPGLDR